MTPEIPDATPDTTAPTSLGKALFAWETPEFREHHRGPNWFLGVGLAAALLVALTIFMGYYVAAIALFLAAIVGVVLAQQRPAQLAVAIHEYGLLVGDKVHRYQDIGSFWILYDPPEVKTLHFSLKKKIGLPLAIELDEQDPNDVRRVLREFLQEDVDREEEFPDKLARILKF